jgi:hypothetical protein
MFDRAHFAECRILRSKTGDTQAIELSPIVGSALRMLWEHAGKPEFGPVFPCRRGPRAGQPKSMRGNSYARRLRRDLLMAGVVRHACNRPADAKALKPFEPCCPNFVGDPLYNDTATSLRVDFHSFRRAFASSMAETGQNAQLSKKLAHHSDDKTHMRYVMNTRAMTRIPEAVVPKVSLRLLTQKTPAVSEAGEGKSKTRMILAPPRRLERPTNGLGKRCYSELVREVKRLRGEMLVSSRLALEALESIGQNRETGWAVAVRALVAVAKHGTKLAQDDAEKSA